MLVGKKSLFFLLVAICLSGMSHSIQGADDDATFWEKNKQKIVICTVGTVTIGFLCLKYYTSANKYPTRQMYQDIKEHWLTKRVVSGALILIGERYGSRAIQKVIDMTSTLQSSSLQAPVNSQDITSILPCELVLNMGPSIIQDLVEDLKKGCLDPEDFDIGFILYGPPGTGKTELAKALCLYLDIPFFYLKSSDFKSFWINESSNNLTKRLREISNAFEGCALLFIDEIDEIVSQRRIVTIGSRDDEKVVSVLLQFTEGLKNNKDRKLIFFGATNHIKAIDPAFLDRMQLVKMNLPTPESRRTALEAYLSHYFPDQASRDLVFPQELKEFIVKTSEGFSFRPLLAFVKSVYRYCTRKKTITIEIILEKLKEQFCKEKQNLHT